MSDYKNIKLEKGMYASSKGFNECLKELDPDELYIGTPLENLDAYQRQLKRFDIRVSGKGSDRIEKFFQTTESAALFPEYVNRAVRQGMDEADLLSKLVATTTQINGLDYRSIASVPTADDKELKVVAEGAFIPQTVIKTKENLVTLHKRGRMLVSSYEAIKYQSLDLFTVTLRQIGRYIAESQLNDAVDVLINGDGNDNKAGKVQYENLGKLAYSDLIKLWNGLAPYNLTTIAASSDMTDLLLSLDEFKDSGAGLTFHATGKMITPLGAELVRISSLPEYTVIGLDSSCALELVEAGGVMTEYDKLIDRQLERAAVTCTAGFSKIFSDAVKVMNGTV
ncbi:MAG: phage major capsid protein [Clostridiales bacterium]|nr:phage major capsid protein [Clostridiales bacterium]